jgi:hypothetical protein
MALYSDLMKTLHEEAFYQGVYQPDEVEYAMRRVGEAIAQLEEEARGCRAPLAAAALLAARSPAR